MGQQIESADRVGPRSFTEQARGILPSVHLDVIRSRSES